MNVICADASPVALAALWGRLLIMLPGSEIFCCRSAEKALAIAEDQGCSILITDIDFGAAKGEGILLAEEIMKICPKANIIFATAAAAGEFASRILKIRYSGVLNKPYTLNELRAELENLRYETDGTAYGMSADKE